MENPTLPPIDLTAIFKALSEPWKEYERSIASKGTASFHTTKRVNKPPRKLKKRQK